MIINCLILCILLTSNVYSSDNKLGSMLQKIYKESSIKDVPIQRQTPQQFLEELTSNSTNGKWPNLSEIEQHSIIIDPRLYKRATEGDPTAMSVMAEETEGADVPPLVHIYWLARLVRFIEEIKEPTESDLQKKQSAESKFQKIYLQEAEQGLTEIDPAEIVNRLPLICHFIPLSGSP